MKKTPCFLAIALLYLNFGTVFALASESSKEAAGFLYSNSKNGKRIVVPMKSTYVVVDIGPGIVETTVVQEFSNETDEALECHYLFPLPSDAVVSGMELHYDDRIVRSLVQEKGVARKTYEDAKAAGKKAALVENPRGNLYQTSVANFLSGETVQGHLSYVEELPFQKGVYEYRLPLVTDEAYFPEVRLPAKNPIETVGRAVEVVVETVEEFVTQPKHVVC